MRLLVSAVALLAGCTIQVSPPPPGADSTCVTDTVHVPCPSPSPPETVKIPEPYPVPSPPETVVVHDTVAVPIPDSIWEWLERPRCYVAIGDPGVDRFRWAYWALDPEGNWGYLRVTGDTLYALRLWETSCKVIDTLKSNFTVVRCDTLCW